MAEVYIVPGDRAFHGGHVRAINNMLDQLSPGRRSRITKADQANQMVAGKFVAAAIQGEEGELVGMATLTDTSTLTGRRLLVDDVVVLEECRGQGIGQKLMEEIIKWARLGEYQFIELTSKPERLAANALYQKLGFVLRKTNAYRLHLM